MVLAQIGKFPKEQMGLGQEMAKFQAIDSQFDTLGIQEGDILIAFNKYKLAEDAEFIAIAKAAQASTKEYVQKGIAEIQRAQQAKMQAAAEARAKAEREAGNIQTRVFGEGAVGPDGEKAEDLGW